MQVRIARQTRDLAAAVTFYRDGLGLQQIAAFDDHNGYSGVMLALTPCGAHLEFTSTPHGELPQPHEESLLVLYLGSRQTVDARLKRLAAQPVSSANPYWDNLGVTVTDPDGFRVVLAAARWGENGVEADPAR